MSWSCSRVQDADLGVWESLLAGTPHTPFFSPTWMEAACRLTGGVPVRLLILKGDEPVASASLHERHGPVGTEILPPPFGVFHAPCWGPGREGSDLLHGTQALAAWLESNYGASSLTFPPEVTDMRGFLWRSWKARVHYTFRIPLGDAEANRRACADDGTYYFIV